MKDKIQDQCIILSWSPYLSFRVLHCSSWQWLDMISFYSWQFPLRISHPHFRKPMLLGWILWTVLLNKCQIDSQNSSSIQFISFLLLWNGTSLDKLNLLLRWQSLFWSCLNSEWMMVHLQLPQMTNWHLSRRLLIPTIPWITAMSWANTIIVWSPVVSLWEKFIWLKSIVFFIVTISFLSVREILIMRIYVISCGFG